MAERVPPAQEPTQDEAMRDASPMVAPVPAAPEDVLPTETKTIGKIERIPLREVWKHEAHNLTVWLEDNIDVLNEVLHFNLTSAEREQAAGAFSVDLVGEDERAGR